MIILDTNVISELVKPRPDPGLVAWIQEINESLLYLSVLTLGEIRKGVAALPQSVRRTALEAWRRYSVPGRADSRHAIARILSNASETLRGLSGSLGSWPISGDMNPR